MKLHEANQLLGNPDKTPEKIRAAFAATVRLSHPDTAGETRGLGASIERLQAARDLLLKALAEPLNQVQEIACKMCGGSGRVGTGFGAPCASCRGTGNTNG